MSWSNQPMPTQGSVHMARWSWVAQFWYALDERAKARGGDRFPTLSLVHAQGMTTTYTNQSVTVENSDGDPFVWADDYWLTGDSGILPGYGAPWDLIIHLEGEDPRYMIRTQVTGNTASRFEFDEGDVADQLVQMDRDLSDLDDKPWFLIPTYGLWKPDRWPVFPNDERDRGNVDAATTSSITQDDPSHQWLPNEHVGRQIVVLGSDGRIHRVDVTSNTGTELRFANQSWTPVVDTPWTLVMAGGIGIPGREPGNRGMWYNSSLHQEGTHYPDDTLAGAYFPATFVLISHPLPAGTCETRTHGAFDKDVWTDFSGLGSGPSFFKCGLLNYPMTPGLYRGLRGLQVALMNDYCTAFVEMKDYNGWSGDIHNFSIAEWFKYCNINVVSIPWTNNTEVAQNVYVTILKSDGTIRRATTWDSDTELSDGNTYLHRFTVQPGEMLTKSMCHPDYEGGDTFIASLGFTRGVQREFRHFYNRTAWIPDTYTEGLSTSILPNAVRDWEETGDLGVGTWIKRDKSDRYREPDELGYCHTDNGPVFKAGDKARYVADNWCDPTIPEVRPVNAGTGAPNVLWSLGLQNNYDKFYLGKRQSGDPVKTGSITHGTKHYLYVDNVDWWDDGDSLSGVSHTESGTASGGSTTTLEDTSKTGEDGAFWGESRFENFDSPWQGFILEIDKDFDGTDLVIDAMNNKKVTSSSHTFVDSEIGSTLNITGGTDWTVGSYTIVAVAGGAAILNNSPGDVGLTAGEWDSTVTFRVPITGSTGTTLEFDAVDGLNVNAGDEYRIREPYRLNRWEGRQVVIALDGGGTLDLEITHSDDKRLYFEPQANPVTGTFSIVEKEIGTVWKWNGNAWVVPTGINPDTGNEYPLNQKNIGTTIVKRYGRLRNGDVVVSQNYREIYTGIQALQWTLHNAFWTNDECYWPHSQVGTPKPTLDETIGYFMLKGSNPPMFGEPVPTPAQVKAEWQTQFESWRDSSNFFLWNNVIDYHTSPDQTAANPTWYNFISMQENSPFPPAWLWNYSQETKRAKLRASGLPVKLPSVAKYLTQARKPRWNVTLGSHELDEWEGTTGVLEDKWCLFETDGASLDTERTSDAFVGTTDFASAPSDNSANAVVTHGNVAGTPTTSENWNATKGYVVTNQKVILDWSGAMSYA
jgi:hypothetical protein